MLFGSHFEGKKQIKRRFWPFLSNWCHRLASQLVMEACIRDISGLSSLSLNRFLSLSFFLLLPLALALTLFLSVEFTVCVIGFLWTGGSSWLLTANAFPFMYSEYPLQAQWDFTLLLLGKKTCFLMLNTYANKASSSISSISSQPPHWNKQTKTRPGNKLMWSGVRCLKANYLTAPAVKEWVSQSTGWLVCGTR